MSERRFLDHETIKDSFRVGKTVYTVNQIFTSGQTKREVWSEIVTRAESLKNSSLHTNES